DHLGAGNLDDAAVEQLHHERLEGFAVQELAEGVLKLLAAHTRTLSQPGPPRPGSPPAGRGPPCRGRRSGGNHGRQIAARPAQAPRRRSISWRTSGTKSLGTAIMVILSSARAASSSATASSSVWFS